MPLHYIRLHKLEKLQGGMLCGRFSWQTDITDYKKCFHLGKKITENHANYFGSKRLISKEGKEVKEKGDQKRKKSKGKEIKEKQQDSKERRIERFPKRLKN